MELIMFSIISG